MKTYLPLCPALVAALQVLEHAGPSDIHPDVAVRAMENIASSLRRLDMPDQVELRHAFLQIARDSRDPSYREFVQTVPDMLGLAGADAAPR